MPRVLVVDDDRPLVKFLSVVLTSEHIDVDEAYSGEEALHFLADQREPDLVLLDLSMPDMNGRDVFREARHLGVRCPIVFCSAHGASDANRTLGGQGAIQKPFEAEQLIDVVWEQLAN